MDQVTPGDTIQGKVWQFRTEGPASVDEINNAIPLEFNLSPVYPNPFNQETKISYSASHPTRISISIFDVNGRLIKTLFNQQVKKGEHSLIWDASDLTSGVYLIRLT